MQTYRGYTIELIEGACWSARLTELASGTELTSFVWARRDEGGEVCAERARQLVDLYLAALERRRQRRRRLQIGVA